MDHAQYEGLSFVEESVKNMISQMAPSESTSNSDQDLDQKLSGSDSESSSKDTHKLPFVRIETEGDQLMEEDEEDDEDADYILDRNADFFDMNALREAAVRYSKKHKFAISTQRSGDRQIVLVCKHAGEYRPAMSFEYKMSEGKRKGTRKKLSQRIQCPFEIRGKPSGDHWVVDKIHLTHNHEMAKDVRVYAQHRKVPEDVKKLIIDLIVSNMTNKQIKQVISLQGHKLVTAKDISNIRSVRKRKLAKEANK